MMKQIFRFCLIAILAIAMASGCKKDPDPDFPVKFDLKLLDSTGQSLNTLKEGDTITLSFELYNSTKEDVSLDNFLFDLSSEDFFNIYRQSYVGTWVYFGKFCTSFTLVQAVNFYSLNASTTVKFQYKLPSPYKGCPTGNTFLKRGNYRTGVNYTFKMNDSKYNNQKKTFNTTVYFTIQ